MKIIEITKLSKNYGDFQAVKEISFFVEKGEIFGFLGPNGAGKTTTINMLTGLARPTSGEIIISGQDGVKDIKKVQRIIGIVPDESNLYDELSGFDNLVFCASLYGMGRSEREKRAWELLTRFGLDDAGKRPFKAYSKGMKRKLTIAAGIIHEPEILFLDEPTTGIDVKSARQIRELLKALNEQGTTIFLTTHYIEEAEWLCRRIGFIVDGNVIKVSHVDDLLREAQKENIIEFTIEKTSAVLKSSLLERFPGITIKKVSDHSVRIGSTEKIELMPFMKFFAANSIKISEARIIRPSLEEVFVKITGIEIEKLKAENEGKKKWKKL
ncbi:MAG: ATP-binding cassette domain-containing protein [Firmicutes bacterium]|nr:ATP-binding cassette domain-containing protein [Bacillota bacterium]